MSGTQLTPIAQDLWIVTRPLRFLTLFPIGTRMTVVRLSDGTLWLCSPVEIDDELAAMLDALGPVRHLVGPNRFHHLYLGPAKERYTKSQLYLAPGLETKRSDLTPAIGLTGDAPSAWAGELDQCVLEGVPTFNEVAFLHRQTRTLIVTDHLFHLDDTCPAIAQALGVMMGVRRKPGLPLDARLLFIRDKDALRRSLTQVLSWDFDRVILTHGSIVETNGHRVMQDAYRFLFA